MSDDLTSQSATELIRLIKTGGTSCVEVVQSYLQRIEKVNPALNAIVTIAPDVLEQARVRDQQRADGRLAGPLHGLPITIKDTIDTEGLRTTYGSRLFAGHVPLQDASVVARLKAAGAIVLGKTNVPEMAIPYETDNPVFGRTNHPFDSNRTPGGSSGGEAAAIASRISVAGIGSDLAGSIRVPAHFCGIASLKPTSGVVPMEGHLPRATGTLALGACIGPMARSVADLATLFEVMAPGIPHDFTKDLRVAWYVDDHVAPVAPEIVKAVQRAAESLREAGFEVRQEIPPGVSNAPRLWIELFSRAANEQIREIYRGREHEAGPAVSHLLQSADPLTLQDKVEAAETLAKAVIERAQWREELLSWMRDTPLILSPVSATVAFEHGAARVDADGKSISVFRSASYSQTINVFGLPAAVVPVARTVAGLPIGIQVVGRPSEEHRVLAAAALIEESAGF